MSAKPAPVALTAAMLMRRSIQVYNHSPWDVSSHHACADLASRLHRLAKGAERASVADCNGEMHDGLRSKANGLEANMAMRMLDKIDDEVAKYCSRIDKQISKLSAELAPFALMCKRNGDPRGYSLKVYSTDPARPMPHNDMGGDCWGIES